MLHSRKFLLRTSLYSNLQDPETCFTHTTFFLLVDKATLESLRVRLTSDCRLSSKPNVEESNYSKKTYIKFIDAMHIAVLQHCLLPYSPGNKAVNEPSSQAACWSRELL
jgi:hypothetical protein